MNSETPREPDLRGPADRLMRFELRILELLLDDVGLRDLRARLPEHPAVARYDRITRFLDHHVGLQYPNETDLVLEHGSLLLDGFLLVGAEGADMVATIEAEVLHQLRRRVGNPGQFADQMTALTFWGMLRSKDIHADIVEEEGLPDISIPIRAAEKHWVEVKRIHLGAVPRRIRDDIKDANDKIKRAVSDGVGSLYVFIERPQQRVVLDGSIPPEVQQYIDEAERELGSAHSKSVADVIIAWDDYIVTGEPPATTIYVLRRRLMLLHHRSPRAPSQLPQELASLGRTVMLPIVWATGTGSGPGVLPAIRAGSITVTQRFRQVCEATRDVRSVHAIEAVQHPAAERRYRLEGDKSFLLVTKRVAVAHKPYTLLVLGAVLKDGGTEIDLAFRLYDDDAHDTEEVLNDPLVAFTTLLERYGVLVTVGDLEGLFIPTATVDVGKGQAIVSGSFPSGEDLIVHALVMPLVDNKTVNVAWAFALLEERYRSDGRRRRR